MDFRFLAAAVAAILLVSSRAADCRRALAGDSSSRDRDGDSSDSSERADRDSSERADRDSSEPADRDSSERADRDSSEPPPGESSSSGRSAENKDPTSDGADSSGNLKDNDCAGRGSEYCRTEYAAQAKKCPKACTRGECDRSGRSAHTSAIRSGVYDFAYVLGGLICVRKCDGKGACVDWDKTKGQPFCKAIRCEDHTLDGCHGSDDFDRPTCEDCAWLFPNACGDEASVDREFDEDDDDDGDRFRAYMLNGPLWSQVGEPADPPQTYVAGAVRVGVISANETIVANLTLTIPP
jgi:hypothetical protein